MAVAMESWSTPGQPPSPLRRPSEDASFGEGPPVLPRGPTRPGLRRSEKERECRSDIFLALEEELFSASASSGDRSTSRGRRKPPPAPPNASSSASAAGKARSLAANEPCLEELPQGLEERKLSLGRSQRGPKGPGERGSRGRRSPSLDSLQAMTAGTRQAPPELCDPSIDLCKLSFQPPQSESKVPQRRAEGRRRSLDANGSHSRSFPRSGERIHLLHNASLQDTDVRGAEGEAEEGQEAGEQDMSAVEEIAFGRLPQAGIGLVSEITSEKWEVSPPPGLPRGRPARLRRRSFDTASLGKKAPGSGTGAQRKMKEVNDDWLYAEDADCAVDAGSSKAASSNAATPRVLPGSKRSCPPKEAAATRSKSPLSAVELARLADHDPLAAYEKYLAGVHLGPEGPSRGRGCFKEREDQRPGHQRSLRSSASCTSECTPSPELEEDKTNLTPLGTLASSGSLPSASLDPWDGVTPPTSLPLSPSDGGVASLEQSLAGGFSPELVHNGMEHIMAGAPREPPAREGVRQSSSAAAAVALRHARDQSSPNMLEKSNAKKCEAAVTERLKEITASRLHRSLDHEDDLLRTAIYNSVMLKKHNLFT